MNGLNQITSSGPDAIGHDARGNVTAIGGTTYGYDGRDLLTRYPGGYVYNDPLDRLFDVSGERRWLMRSGDDVLSEIGYDGLLKRRYVHGPGVDEPLVWYEGAGLGDRRYLHADERGSVVAVTNGAGAATAINSYDEYGRPGAANQGRFGYTGQKWIADLGLYDYKARMYAPQPGRFMQTDPIGYADGMLLGNAVAHGGNSGAIEVRVTANATIQVSDEGPGMPVEARNRIFEPVHRERWDRDGCGLGLYLVREIMETQGGQAAVRGERPGATFVLRFRPPTSPESSAASLQAGGVLANAPRFGTSTGLLHKGQRPARSGVTAAKPPVFTVGSEREEPLRDA